MTEVAILGFWRASVRPSSSEPNEVLAAVKKREILAVKARF
jgi:hypothetical protein